MYIELSWTEENIKKFKSPDNLLKHARYNKSTDGIILVNPKDNKLVGYVGWEGDKIIALEVSPDYWGQGIATYLISRSGCNNLSVNRKNFKAINLYKKLGFRIVSQTPVMYFMKNNNNYDYN